MVTEFRGYHTNIQLLKVSRKKQRPGDVFVLRVADDKYLFGRIIRDDAQWALGDHDRVNLAYVYEHVSAVPTVPDHVLLGRESLLVPPFFVTGLWWSRGYFQTLENIPLVRDDVLPQHCFLKWSNGRYYDEYNNELSGPIEPVGRLSLPNIAAIDSKLSLALGIPEVDYSKYE